MVGIAEVVDTNEYIVITKYAYVPSYRSYLGEAYFAHVPNQCTNSVNKVCTFRNVI